ncbi:hypothetical protein EDC04DRAFT_2981981 [Pisolithus marmoratus]|nr:hypothetical protein EDC04DRAFT_2981981 [Pisolithus marmoratus]
MTNVLGVLVIACNGDRDEFYQNPKTYEPQSAESAPLGAVESFQLGSCLRSVYLNPSSPSYIANMKTDLVNTHAVHFYAKAGGEGPVIFDSAIALLQGLFPPTPKNKITLANETTIVAPLGGYQYVPIETVEPSNDHTLEPWTDCPAFKDHISKVYASSEFKEKAKSAAAVLWRHQGLRLWSTHHIGEASGEGPVIPDSAIASSRIGYHLLHAHCCVSM